MILRLANEKDIKGLQPLYFELEKDAVNFQPEVSIRKLSSEERSTALDLAWRVFSEYESPDYGEEGIEEFRKCLHDEGYLAGIEYYGAFEGED